MNKPLISVIVPIYNVALYLDRCILSLIGQTYKKIEIILVNDGSTDGSQEICEKYQKEYPNVHLINKENGGLSSARNIGLEKCTGEYIIFVDADDWIDLDTCEYAFFLLKKHDADIVQYNVAMVNRESDLKQPKEEIKVISGLEILQYYMLTTTTTTGSYSVCRCLFPRILIGNLRFREGKINEDIDFKYKVFAKCKRLVITNQYKYYYFQREISNSNGGLKKKDFDLYDAAEELYNLTKDQTYGTIAKLGEVKKARTAFSLLSKIAYYGISDDELDKESIIRKLEKEHRKNLRILIFAPLPVSRKILCVLFALNFYITMSLIHLYKETVQLLRKFKR